jgi:hypothetical protein
VKGRTSCPLNHKSRVGPLRAQGQDRLQASSHPHTHWGPRFNEVHMLLGDRLLRAEVISSAFLDTFIDFPYTLTLPEPNHKATVTSVGQYQTCTDVIEG